MNKTKQTTNRQQPDFVTKNVGKTPKKEKKPFYITNQTAIITDWIACVLFAVVAAVLLVARNSDLLYQAQNLSFFTGSKQYFDECMSLPGGLITWLSSFFAQFLYIPALGASVYIAFWIVTFYVSKKALRVTSIWAAMLMIPVTILLISVIDNGYWIYYIKQQGFWFYATVGFLASMLMTWAAQISTNKIYRSVLAVAIALTYPLMGWYSLLTLVYVSVVDFVQRKDDNSKLVNKLSIPILSAVLIIAVPLACYNIYPNIRIDSVWTVGLPTFQADTMVSITPQLPFLALAISPVLLALLPKDRTAVGMRAKIVALSNIIIICVCVVCAFTSNVQDYNYHAEMRMYRAVENQEWDKVLDEMSNLPGDANRQMVLFKNIALLNKGEMGTKMFKYNNMGNNPHNDFDTLNVHMVQTGAPLIYYNHAKTNFSIRWCIENGVEYGPKFNDMKILAQCSLINGEMGAARKYLTILQNTIYHREWAERYLPIVDKPSLISKYHEFDNIRELRDHMGSVLDGDQGLCEMYLLSYFSNTMNVDSKLLAELTLNYAMVQKDIQLFWPRFFNYANQHKGEEMPLHYQEAALLYGNLEKTVDISKMPFDKERVLSRYAGFQQLSQSLLSSGMKTKEVGEAMKSTYGDTFYWFYFFCRDVHSY